MDNKKLKHIGIIEKHLSFILILGVIAILILPTILTYDWGIKWLPNFEGKGDIGDVIGGITSPIIGIITILLVYLTYHSQKLELNETKQALERQNNITQTQQFESTYFNMLKQLDTITEHSYYNFKISEEDYNKISSGSYYFKELVNQIKSDLVDNYEGHLLSIFEGNHNVPDYVNELIKRFPITEKEEFQNNKIILIGTYFISNKEVNPNTISEQDLKDYISIIYNHTFNKHSHNLGHFFRYLNNIIRFIEKSDIEDKDFYFRLLQAQMSDPQIALIFYNGISDISKNKEDINVFRMNVDTFNLLENLKSDYVPNGYLPNLFYPKTSFKWFSKERLYS